MLLPCTRLCRLPAQGRVMCSMGVFLSHSAIVTLIVKVLLLITIIITFIIIVIICDTLVSRMQSQSKFGLLSEFMCNLLALPHSSASVERIFSQLNMIKTNQTNRLHVATTANRILAKQSISRQDVPCYNWEPLESLINDVKSGKCHQRYVSRRKMKEKMHLATLYSGNGSDDDDDLSMQFFRQ